MDFKIAVLAGDGIGPEISVQGVDVMSAVCEKFGHKVSYEYAICGADAIDKVGDPFPEETYQVCKNADAVLFSAVGDPKFDNDPTAKVRPEQGLLAMRKKLGLFANIRPVQTFKCLIHKSPLRAELVENADFICIRELTGGMYFGEKYQDNDKAYDTNYYTRPEIERILKVAFEYAMKRRKHLTVVDKANVLYSLYRIQLEGMGVSAHHIEIAGICTYTHHEQFFSARRLGVQSGRILSGIMLNDI